MCNQKEPRLSLIPPVREKRQLLWGARTVKKIVIMRIRKAKNKDEMNKNSAEAGHNQTPARPKGVATKRILEP